MGAWGVNTFDNDTACDWAYQLEEVDDFSLVDSSLDAVIETRDGYLNADVAAEALAACEVIARLKGHWGIRNSFTETVDQWVEQHRLSPTPALIQKAVTVIERVLGASSELRELWQESDEFDTWRSSVEELRNRVQT